MLWILWPLFGAILLTGSMAFGYKHGHDIGAHEVQAQWDEERAQAAIKSQELQTNMDKLREGKNRELARLNRTVNALSDSLRSRPERPTGATADARDGASGCTGATLYRPDSAFLVGEAERADTIRIALIQCQAAYRSAF
jgi:hypothetical protein